MKLNKFIKENFKNQTQAAEFFGVTVSTLGKWVRGERGCERALFFLDQVDRVSPLPPSALTRSGFLDFLSFLSTNRPK